MEDWNERGHLFVVADGMGAHAAGELASKLAVDQVAYLYRKHRDRSATDAILSAIREANDEVHRRGQANLSFHNMGTTCSVLLLLPQGAVAAHVGDSRIYRLRRGTLQQLTFDHSLVWEMQHAIQGRGSVDTLALPKNVITRSIGPHASVKVDLEGPYAVDVGDTFLLCSDGLTTRVEDVEIASALTHLAPPAAAEFLRDLAVLRGGPDNITLIAIRVLSADMATRTVGVASLTVSEGTPASPQVWLGFWLGLWLFLLLTVVLLAMGQMHWAWAALAAAILPLLGILAQRLALFREGPLRISHDHGLGKGPYTATQALSVLEFRQRLDQFIEEAQDAALERGWELHRQPGQPEATGGDAHSPGIRPAADGLREIVRSVTELAELCRKNQRLADTP